MANPIQRYRIIFMPMAVPQTKITLVQGLSTAPRAINTMLLGQKMRTRVRFSILPKNKTISGITKDA